MKKHRVFISYHHKDHKFKLAFEQSFGHLFFNTSVREGDIAPDNQADYVKRLINEGYIDNASVVVVLIGAKTYCRKHVDWEISAALDARVGGRAGLVGICIPGNPDYPGPYYQASHTPARFVDNQQSGYAQYYDWTDDEEKIALWIEEAFTARITRAELAVNNRIQMQHNLCD